MHATNATYATNERIQDMGENPRVLNAAGAVDNRKFDPTNVDFGEVGRTV